MMSIRKLNIIALAALLIMVVATGVLAETKGSARKVPGSDKVTLDFKDITLPDLIQTVSELTGKNFLYDESVKGKVTVISPDEMTMDEAYQLFLTVLNVKGYTLIPSGKVNKIIPTREAKENNLPTVIDGSGKRASEQFVTRLVRLKNIEADVMASTVLAPLIPKTSNIVAYPPTNTLIITDSGTNIERLVRIVRELDEPSSLDLLEVIPLQHASAEEVAKIASQVISQGATTAKSSRSTRAKNVKTAGEKEVSKVIPFSRTNVLIVIGNSDDIAAVKDLVAELDQQPTRERSNINVYYLENADAESLAKTLNEILTGIRTQAKSTRTAQPNQAAALTTEALSITADKPTNSLIINSNPEDYEVIKGIVRQLDIKRKQVFVEALILELSMDATKRLGASLQGAVGTSSDSVVFGSSNLNSGATGLGSLAPTGDAGFPSLLTQTIDGILLGGLFSPITTTLNGEEITIPALSALIDISKTDTDVNILSAPRLLTSDNEEAEIVVGQNVPIITERLTDTTNVGAQSVSVERKDVALTLRFTPQVTEGDLVRLNIYQEITNLAQSSVGDVDEVGPTFTKRLLRNTVLAENGKTVVLGGLIDTNIQETITKTPLLGDIPFLGWLFKRKLKQETKTNLLIFITPTIIRNPEDLTEITLRSKNVMSQMQVDKVRSSLPAAALPAGTWSGYRSVDGGQ